MKKYLWLLLLIWAAPSFAEKQWLVYHGRTVLVGTKDSFYMEVDDQVKDGCLPQPQRLKNAMELVLRGNNFKIESSPGGSMLKADIDITALGYAINQGYTCVVSLGVELKLSTVTQVPWSEGLESSTAVLYFEEEVGRTILTGPKSSMQNRLERATETFSKDLVLEIHRARDVVRKNWPAILERQAETRKKISP